MPIGAVVHVGPRKCGESAGALIADNVMSEETRAERLNGWRQGAVINASGKGAWIVPLLLVGLLAVTIGASLGEGHWALACCAAGTVCLGAILFDVGRRNARALLSVRVFVAVSILQAFWIGVLGVVGGPTFIAGSALGIELIEQPMAATLSLLTVPLGAVMAAVSLGSFFPRTQSSQPLLARRDSAIERALWPFLAIWPTLVIAYWPASGGSAGEAGYGIRVMYHTFHLLPFLAGRYLNQHSRLHRIWLLVLAANALAGALVGSRLFASLPIALFVLGFLTRASARQRRRWILGIAGAALPLFYASGMVEAVRTQIGRGGIELLTEERLTEFIAASGAASQHEASRAALFGDGVRRMIAWSNQAAILMSPDIVPFRRFDGFVTEVRRAMSIEGTRLEARRELLEAGLYSAPATRYGFNVNEGTSVEFPLLADGWSRGGWVVATLFGVLAGLMLGSIDLLCLRLAGRALGWSAVGSLLSIKGAFDFGGQPLVTATRGMVLGILLLVAVSSVLWVAAGALAARRPR